MKPEKDLYFDDIQFPSQVVFIRLFFLRPKQFLNMLFPSLMTLLTFNQGY